MSDYTATAFIDFTLKNTQVSEAEDIINIYSQKFPDAVTFKIGVTYEEKYANISLVITTMYTAFNVSEMCNTIIEQIMDLVDEG